jgi:hypothetical protein
VLIARRAIDPQAGWKQIASSRLILLSPAIMMIKGLRSKYYYAKE